MGCCVLLPLGVGAIGQYQQHLAAQRIWFDDLDVVSDPGIAVAQAIYAEAFEKPFAESIPANQGGEVMIFATIAGKAFYAGAPTWQAAALDLGQQTQYHLTYNQIAEDQLRIDVVAEVEMVYGPQVLVLAPGQGVASENAVYLPSLFATSSVQLSADETKYLFSTHCYVITPTTAFQWNFDIARRVAKWVFALSS
jgi:hypothetical protein